MKFIVMVKATPNSEAGVLPTEQLLTEMGRARLASESRADVESLTIEQVGMTG